MSSAGIVAIVSGTVQLAEIAAVTYLGCRVIDRLRLCAPHRGGAAPGALPPVTALAPQWHERQRQYNALRGEGKDADVAAKELGITAGSTRRDYEKRWRAAA